MYSNYFEGKADKLFESIQDEIRLESFERGEHPILKAEANNKKFLSIKNKHFFVDRCQTAAGLKKKSTFKFPDENDNQVLQDYFTRLPNRQLVQFKISKEQEKIKYLEELGDLENYQESEEINSSRPQTQSYSLPRSKSQQRQRSLGFYRIKRNEINSQWKDMNNNNDDNFQKDESKIEKLYKNSIGIQQQILNKGHVGVGKRIKQFYGLDFITKEIEKINYNLLNGKLKI